MWQAPVIERELRVEARKRGTYYARFLWGLAGVGVLAFVVGVAGPKIQDGSYLFAVIHASLLTMFLLLAPMIAADSISRERREGTLGLLFLTPLTARHVILGKLASHLLRLFYFWLMFIPFLLLPALAGGVTADQFLVSIAVLFSVLLIGIAAGMIASAVSISVSVAVFRALLLSVALYVAFSAIAVNLPAKYLARGFYFEEPAIIRLFVIGPFFLFFPGQFMMISSRMFGAANLSSLVAVALLALSFLATLFAIIFCARKIQGYVESSIPSPRRVALRKKFLTPVLWKERFRRSMNEKLSRNPFVWLEYREAWARAARFAAVLALVVIENFLVISEPSLDGFLIAQFYMLVALIAAITLKSATSFQYEKQSGAVELILVTPITEETLVSGRLRAVLSYYMPICVALVGFILVAVLWLKLPFREFGDPSPFTLANLGLCILSVPAAGLFFALRCKSFLQALAFTVGVAIAGAPALWAAMTNLIWYAAHRLEWSFAYLLEENVTNDVRVALLTVAAFHAIVIFLCRHQALRVLQRRSFAYQKPA